MPRIILDAETIKKLVAPLQSVEICDEAGKPVGVFEPILDPQRYDLEPEIGEDELRRRLKETGGLTLTEILVALEKLA
jgi:hypothetical protein